MNYTKNELYQFKYNYGKRDGMVLSSFDELDILLLINHDNEYGIYEFWNLTKGNFAFITQSEFSHFPWLVTKI